METEFDVKKAAEFLESKSFANTLKWILFALESVMPRSVDFDEIITAALSDAEGYTIRNTTKIQK